VSPSNPAYTARELASQIEDSGSSVLFTVPELLPLVLEAAKACHVHPSKIYLLGRAGVERTKTIRDLYDNPSLVPRVVWTKRDLKRDPAYLCYSSGTTGP
jgi:4-coumarate--CoA ligase